MASSVKKNYIFNLLNSLTQVLLPLLTFPYASRILLPDGIGHVNSFASIINVITVCVSLGIPLYSIKLVASIRDSAKQLSITTCEVFCLHVILTIIGYFVIALLCFIVPQINDDIPLFLLLSLSILFTTIGCEWFYQAVEDFKYITIRGIIVRLTSIIFLFLTVRTKQDIMWYAAFTVFGVLGSNIFNFIRLRNYINLQYVNFRSLNPFKHLKGVIKIFAFNIATSMYSQLNVVFLSFFISDMVAGYYTSAQKLNMTVLTISYTISNVMLPRLTNLIANHNNEKFRQMAQKSFDFSIAITLPMCVGMMFISPYAIMLLSGEQFISAVSVSKIMSFTIFFIAISNVMGVQMLFPMGYMNKVVKCVTIGCLVDIIACVILIPVLKENGAALSYLLAEVSVTLSLFITGKKLLPLQYFKKSNLIYILAVIIMGICLYFLSHLQINYIVKLFVMIISGVIVYFTVLFLCKEQFTNDIKQIVSNKLNSKN